MGCIKNIDCSFIRGMVQNYCALGKKTITTTTTTTTAAAGAAATYHITCNSCLIRIERAIFSITCAQIGKYTPVTCPVTCSTINTSVRERKLELEPCVVGTTRTLPACVCGCVCVAWGCGCICVVQVIQWCPGGDLTSIWHISEALS